MKNLSRRAVISILTLAMGGGVPLATFNIAHADEEELPDPPAAVTVQPEITGSGGTIVITKRIDSTQSQGAKGNGEITNTFGGTPGEGFTFRACQILGWYDEAYEHYDLHNQDSPEYVGPISNQSWWDSVAEFANGNHSGTNPADSYPNGCYQGTTDANGIAVLGDPDRSQSVMFNGLGDPPGYVPTASILATYPMPLGLWRITEIAPEGYVAGDQFLVTLPWKIDNEPTTDWLTPTVTGWGPLGDEATPGYGKGAYTVYAYPKNGSMELHKTARFTDHGTIVFTISTKIPFQFNSSGIGNLVQIIVTDYLRAGETENPDPREPDTGEFDPNSVQIKVGSLAPFTTESWNLDDLGDMFEDLNNGKGFAVLTSEPLPSTDIVATNLDRQASNLDSDYNWRPLVYISHLFFDSQVWDAINNHQGENLTITYEVKAKEGEPNGIVHNTVTMHDWAANGNTVGPGDEVEVYIGGIVLLKQDLNGLITKSPATFQIYTSQLGGTPIEALDWDYFTADTFSTFPAGSSSSQPAGIALIAGLPYSKGNLEYPGAPLANCWVPKGDGSTPIYGSDSGTLFTANGAMEPTANLVDYFPGTTYWLAELDPPTGYDPIEGRFPVCVTDGGFFDNPNSIYHIVNQRHLFLGIQLPFTGEADAQFPILIGLILVAGAFTYFIVSTRKDSQAHRTA